MAFETDNEFIIVGNKLTKYNGDAAHVVIPEGVEIIERGCFFRKSLKTITIPPGVKEVREAFMQCKNLEEIKLPDIKAIDSDAFHGCSSLKRVELGSELSEMGWNVSNGCSHLEEIELPSTVHEIGAGTFRDCKSLRSIKLNPGLEYIGVEAFRGCRLLQHIMIPETVTNIEAKAFSGCDALSRENIILPEHLSSKTVPDFFMNLDIGRDLDFYTYIGISDENHCLIVDGTLIRYDGEDDNVNVTEGTIIIKQDAFYFNGSEGRPKKVVLPNSIRKIEQGALLGVAIEVDESIFKTTEKLPSEVAAALGDDAETVAFSVIFQSGKPWNKAISKALSAVDTGDVFSNVVGILNSKKEFVKDAAAGRAVNFVADHKNELNKETIDLLGEVLHSEEKKWKKSVKAYEKEFVSNEQHSSSEEAKSFVGDDSNKKSKGSVRRDNENKISAPYVFPTDEDTIINNAISLYERIYNEFCKKIDAYDATVIELPRTGSSYAGETIQKKFYSRLKDYLADDKNHGLCDRLSPDELYESWTKDYGPGIGQVGLGLTLGYVIAEYALCENDASGELVFCRDKWEYRGDYSSATRPALHIESNINKWKVYNKRGYSKFEM